MRKQECIECGKEAEEWEWKIREVNSAYGKDDGIIISECPNCSALNETHKAPLREVLGV